MLDTFSLLACGACDQLNQILHNWPRMYNEESRRQKTNDDVIYNLLWPLLCSIYRNSSHHTSMHKWSDTAMLNLPLPRVKVPHNGSGLLLTAVLRCRRRRLNRGIPRALRLCPGSRCCHRRRLIGYARGSRVTAQDTARGRSGTVSGGRGGRCQRQGGSLLLLRRNGSRGGISEHKEMLLRWILS